MKFPSKINEGQCGLCQCEMTFKKRNHQEWFLYFTDGSAENVGICTACIQKIMNDKKSRELVLERMRNTSQGSYKDKQVL